MNEPTQTRSPEPRWPVVISILGLLTLLTLLPARIRMYPLGLPAAAALVGIVPMVAVRLTAGGKGWLRTERLTTLLLFVLAEAGTTAATVFLVGMMIKKPNEIAGVQLLASSVGVWATNVLAFALLYWQLDRGGPGARADRTNTKMDWIFPEEDAARRASPDWQPAFGEYLYLSFTTATGFGSGYALPLTGRAKALLMAEGAASLVTLTVVASRAINIMNI